VENKTSVQVDNQANIPIISVQGEIDIYNSHELNKTISTVIESGKNNVVLNLENIQYIDSTGLGVIAHAARSLVQKNGKIHIVCNKPQVKKIFEISGLGDKNIQLFDEEALAIKSIN
jgi:anti-sigma B factor antagonist